MSEFNLKAVLRQTGLKAETLRAWEKRYGAVRPSRSKNGRRHYSLAEVHRLRLLFTLVQRGFRIGEIANLKESELTRRIELSRNAQQKINPALENSRGIAELLESLEKLEFDRLRAHMARVRFQFSACEFALELVPAIMHRVGNLLLEERLSIAEEHAISLLVENELRAIYESIRSLDGSAKRKFRIVFATREGDFHGIGLMMTAIICRSYGIQCEYLGVNFPAESLVKSTRAFDAHIVALSLSWLSQADEKTSAPDFLKTLARDLPKSTEIWAGGTGAAKLRSRDFGKRKVVFFETLDDFETKLKTLFGK